MLDAPIVHITGKTPANNLSQDTVAIKHTGPEFENTLICDEEDLSSQVVPFISITLITGEGIRVWSSHGTSGRLMASRWAVCREIGWHHAARSGPKEFLG